ncbi:MAG: CoA transferase [Acetobacteraceae bacterium]
MTPHVEPTTKPSRPGPLAGIRVLDIATMIAAPLTASILGDYGAEVIKVELPGVGDTVRRMGTQRDGVGLYWRTLGRNKQRASPSICASPRRRRCSCAGCRTSTC